MQKSSQSFNALVPHFSSYSVSYVGRDMYAHTSCQRPYVLLLLLLPTFVSFAFTQTCYLPNGDVDGPGNTPCDNSASVSHCCNVDVYCPDNGYCLTSIFNVYRGSCTDKTWGSDCPRYCFDGESRFIAFVSMAPRSRPITDFWSSLSFQLF